MTLLVFKDKKIRFKKPETDDFYYKLFSINSMYTVLLWQCI